MVNLNYLQV